MLALVALFHFSGVSWARETIVSGDSDHAYLPTDHEQEVMLHRFSFISDTSTYLAFGADYTTKHDGSSVVNCVQQHACQASVAMANTNRECTKAENSFRAPRPVRLPRVMPLRAASRTMPLRKRQCGSSQFSRMAQSPKLEQSKTLSRGLALRQVGRWRQAFRPG